MRYVAPMFESGTVDPISEVRMASLRWIGAMGSGLAGEPSLALCVGRTA
jgi:hypothetical protein